VIKIIVKLVALPTTPSNGSNQSNAFLDKSTWLTGHPGHSLFIGTVKLKPN